MIGVVSGDRRLRDALCLAAALFGCGGVPAEAGDAPPDAGPLDAAVAADVAGAAGLRVMTYNIKHGELSSLEAIADVIRAEAPDLVGLQEVDDEAARSGGVSQSYRLGQLTGMASLFRTALDLPGGGQYGLALLSRHPILASEKLSLTSTGEQRILVTVEVELADGRVVPFAITHLGLDAGERATQAQEIAAALAARPEAILVGDLNETPDGPAVGILAGALRDAWPLAGQGGGETIPAAAPTRRIDYVLLGAAWPPPAAARVPAATASDHRPVVVTFAP